MVGPVAIVVAGLLLAGTVASGGAWTLEEESGGISAVGTGEGTTLPGGVGVAPGAIEPKPVNKQLEEEYEANQAKKKAEQEAAEREAAQRKATEAAAKRCVVPSLKGRSLADARTSLSRAHCALGKVSRPRARRGALLVSSQSPAAGKTLAAGALILIRLATARRHD